MVCAARTHGPRPIGSPARSFRGDARACGWAEGGRLHCTAVRCSGLHRRQHLNLIPNYSHACIRQTSASRSASGTRTQLGSDQSPRSPRSVSPAARAARARFYQGAVDTRHVVRVSSHWQLRLAARASANVPFSCGANSSPKKLRNSQSHDHPRLRIPQLSTVSIAMTARTVACRRVGQLLSFVRGLCGACAGGRRPSSGWVRQGRAECNRVE